MPRPSIGGSSFGCTASRTSIGRATVSAASRTVLVALGVVLIAVLIGSAGVAGATAADANNDSESTDSEPTITVSGEGSVDAPPDEAVVSLAVVAEGDDPASVRDDLDDGADGLREALVAANVSADEIETTDLRIEERFRTPGEQEPAYRGVHAFRVTLDDTERVGPVVDAAADAGAEIRWLTYRLSSETRDDLRDEALVLAMDDARRQADTLAAAGDLRVTGIRDVDAANQQVTPVRFEEDVLEVATNGTTIEPGDVSVSATVRVTYDADRAEE